MSYLKKLAPVGALAAAGAFMLAPMGMVSARSGEELKPMEVGGNAAVDVQTEAHCGDHLLIAKVKNKTAGEITPDITYKNRDTVMGQPQSIKPGETGLYNFSFDGSRLYGDLRVAVDGQRPLVLNPTDTCTEPVSFRVQQTSESLVSGLLTNNNPVHAAEVTLSVNGSETRETLQPMESRVVGVPFKPMPVIGGAPSVVSLSVTTDSYSGSYIIDLNAPPEVPPMPEPKKEE